MRDFVLTSIPTNETVPVAAERLSIGIGPVKMPAYLLRPSMTIRKSANEIEYRENAVWAERLDHCFQRTLAANLETELPSSRVYLSAWDRDQVTLKLEVNVDQFDVDAQGRGKLVAHWLLYAPHDSDRLLKSGRADLSRTGAVPHDNPQAVAATLSALLAEFSRELAEAIRQAAQ